MLVVVIVMIMVQIEVVIMVMVVVVVVVLMAMELLFLTNDGGCSSLILIDRVAMEVALERISFMEASN